MNKTEFGNIMAAINAAYPSEKITQDANKVRLWWQMLTDMEYMVVAQNLQRHIKRSSFPPTIAELRGPSQVFNNFTRRNYDMDKLEMALLGINKVTCIEDVKKSENR